MNITTHTEQKSRPYQEDRFFVKELPSGETILGVFDGHGGHWVADYAAKFTPYFFRSLLKSNSYYSTMFKVIERLNNKTNHFYSGSTVSLVLIDKDKTNAYVAILGDSPVIIKDGNENIWIAPEHNVRSNKIEASKAIASDDAYIANGYLFDRYKGMNSGGLQMSRALGDKELNNILNRVPEVFVIPLNENSWILCGSDGLTDPAHGSFDINSLIEDIPNETAQSLVQGAAHHDNVTAILVKF